MIIKYRCSFIWKKKDYLLTLFFLKPHSFLYSLFIWMYFNQSISSCLSLLLSLYLIQLLPLPPRPRREGYFLCPFKKKTTYFLSLSLFMFHTHTHTHTKIKTNKLFSSLTYCLFNQQKKAKNQMRQCYADPACCSLKSTLKPFPLTKKIH